MDEKLKTTINKIVQLSKQNPEFNTELRKALGMETFVNSVTSSDKRIEHIEKYLGLDYYVDNQKSIIDYSFVQEPEVRAQLISDNREMMRFRYGTRYHAISFDEFCRYAHLQAEMLLNYFYDLKNDNINSVIAHIKKYNPTANLDNVKSLGSISYNSKLWAFKTEINLDYKIYTILDYLRRVRNDSSHRSPEIEERSIHDYRKQLVNMGMPLKQDGEVDYFKLEDGSPKKMLYSNMVNNKDWYKDYLYLIWLHNESYESIVNAIEELKQTVIDNISV
jgi:hypothetical protein